MNFIKDFTNIFKSLSEDLEMYLKKDPVATSKIKVFFTNTAFHGLMNYRFYHFFHKYKIYPVSFILYTLTKIFYSMDIHPGADIHPGIVIDHGLGIVIGETASVGTGTLIYHGVTLGAKKVSKGKRHPDVGNNVMLGAGAKVLGPIFIGDGAVVGANSVVLMDIPPKSVAVGIPAKIRKINCPTYSICNLESTINSDFVI